MVGFQDIHSGRKYFFGNRIYRFETKDSIYDTYRREFPLPPEGMMVVEKQFDIPTSIIEWSYGPVTSFSGSNPADLTMDYLTRDIAVGDIDGDRKDDLVLLRKSSTLSIDEGYPERFNLLYFDLDIPDDGGDIDFDVHTEELQNGAEYLTNPGSPRLALANVDGDSTTVEFNEVKAFITDPVVLAVPPYKENIQNEKKCTTKIGKAEGELFAEGTAGQLGVGGNISFKWSPEITLPIIQLKLTSIQAKVSAGYKSNYKSYTGYTVEESYSYQTGYEDNLVIAESYRYDSFMYTVTGHADENQIGNVINVNVPIGEHVRL